MTYAKLTRNCLIVIATLAVPAVAIAAYVTTSPPAPNNFYGRMVSVTDFGAKCDVITGGPAGGSITSPNWSTFNAPAGFLFQGTDAGKLIVITGAANWTLSGWVAGGSRFVFNVGYNTPCIAVGCAGLNTFHPSLIGAAGGAAISDNGGLNIIPSMTVIGTGGWNAAHTGDPAIGTTPETGTMSTTGSTTNGSNIVSVASTSPQLIGLNDQPVFDTSGAAVDPPIEANMAVSSSSGDIPPGTLVDHVTGNQIYLKDGVATASTANEIIYVRGYIITLSQPTNSMTGSAADVLTIPVAPLTTTIQSVDPIHGAFVTLASPASNAVPTYVASKVASATYSGYSKGDFITVVDGPSSINHGAATTLQVISGSNINVYSQVQLSHPPTGSVGEYSTSSPSATGGSFQLAYVSTGQFWYGTDDSAAINNALASAPQGSDVWVPANRSCGVAANPIILPGNNSLRGWDMNSSQIVALNNMTFDQYGYSYVVGVAANTYNFGGGMRDLKVNANKLSQFSCGIEGGENQHYENVSCTGAVTAEWLCGYPTDLPTGQGNQIAGTVFDHILGNSDIIGFGPIALRSSENFLTANSCNAQKIVNSDFRSGWIAILDSQAGFNLYQGNIMDSIEPFNPEYCVVLSGYQLLSDSRCLDPSGAGAYLTGNDAAVHNLYEIWDNSWPWQPGKPVSYFSGTTDGVLIAPGVSGALVDGIGGGTRLASSNQVVQQDTADPTTIVVNNPGASYVVPGAGYAIPNPQGRLTLTSGFPVMSGNVSGASSVYYDCYAGPNVPYFNGFTDALDAISGCEFRAALVSTSGNPGYEQANDIFDVWWWHNGGSPVLCVATNGGGKGWTGDSGGGSLNSRGTGYTQLSTAARGYLTNANPFTTTNGAHCYNLVGSTTIGDYVALAPGGIIPANEMTYIGSFYTTAAGQTSFVPQPTPAAGGGAAIVGIWNEYNHVPVPAVEQDTSSAYKPNGTSWEPADAINPAHTNSITVVDGNQQTPFDLLLTQVVNNSGSADPLLSINLSGSCTVATPATYTSQQSTNPISVGYSFSSPPLVGLHCAQAMEMAASLPTNPLFNASPALTMRLNWQY